MLWEHDVVGSSPAPLQRKRVAQLVERVHIILAVLLNMASSLRKTTTVDRGGIKSEK